MFDQLIFLASRLNYKKQKRTKKKPQPEAVTFIIVSF